MKKIKEIKLPDGVKVGAKPDLFDVYRKGRGTGDRWISYVEALSAMETTQTLQIDLTNVGDIKKHMKAVIYGVRHTAKSMNFNKRIKYALIGSILHLST